MKLRLLVLGLICSCIFSDMAAASGFYVDGVRLNTTVHSLREIRNRGVVRQKWDYSCGSAALSTLLTYYLDLPTSEAAVVVSILRRTDPVRVRSRGGFSLLDLKAYLKRRGLRGVGYSGMNLAELAASPVPVIVPVRVKQFDHFVIFVKRYADRVVVADPAFGLLTMSSARFLSSWKDGVGFIVQPPESAPVTAHNYTGKTLPFTHLQPAQRFIRRGMVPSGLVQ